MKRLALTLFISLVLTLPVLAKTYKIDPEFSSVRFKVPYMGLTHIHGGFEKFKGKIVTGDDGSIENVTGKIYVKSLYTGNEKRDEYVLSSDVLNVKKTKYITFKTLKVKEEGNQKILVGIVDINGVSGMVYLPLTVKGPVKDKKGKKRIGVSTSLQIDRDKFNMTHNPVVEGVALVGNTVTIELDIQAK